MPMKALATSLLLLLCASAWAQTPKQYQGQTFKRKAKKQEFLRFLASYSPSAKAILAAEEATKKPLDYTRYARDDSHQGMIRSFNTVIHETCHAVHYRIAQEKSREQPGLSVSQISGYFISPSIRIAVPIRRHYRSTELNQVVPKAWQEKIFRYSNYVGDGDPVISQSRGIYGLLDEFGAYYHGTKADLDLLGYYQALYPLADVDNWVKYLSNPQSTLQAYYAFRLFISWYLLHAQDQHPDVYSDCMENQALRVAFTLLDHRFGQLVERYFQDRDSIMARVGEASGKRLEVSNGYLNIHDNGGRSGTSAPDERIAYLKSLFTDRDREMLQLFRVEGVNESNYASFLE